MKTTTFAALVRGADFIGPCGVLYRKTGLRTARVVQILGDPPRPERFPKNYPVKPWPQASATGREGGR